MIKPQIIRTPSGEELVVLPRAKYEALVERADLGAEDANDVALYDVRKAELAADGVSVEDPPEFRFLSYTQQPWLGGEPRVFPVYLEDEFPNSYELEGDSAFRSCLRWRRLNEAV